MGGFSLAFDEMVFGFGEKFGPLNKRGQSIQTLNKSSIVGEEGTNACTPWYFTNKGYGVFFNTFSPMLFDVGAKSNTTLSFSSADSVLEMHFMFNKNLKKLLSDFVGLVGKPQLPPLWSLGIWLSRCSYLDQEEVLGAANQMRALDLPVDVIRIDPTWFLHLDPASICRYSAEWDLEKFPDPAQMIEQLAQLNIKLCLWINYAFYHKSDIYRELQDKGLLIQDAEDEQSGIVDLTTAAGASWFKNHLKSLVDQGVATFFLDDGATAPMNGDCKGAEPKNARNKYSYLFSQIANEAIAEVNGKGITWGLTGYTGTQQYGAVCGGDARSSYSDMAAIVRGGLSAALSGFPFYGCDIGGFGLYPGPFPDKHVYLRHIEHGFLLPFANLHGSTPREPWHYGEDAVSIFRKYAELRYSLLPYLYSCAYRASDAGIPMMRPLFLEFQDDLTTYHIEHQYMLGDSIMVVPILDERESCRLYLPEGIWYDLWTQESLQDGKWISYKTPIDIIPLFVKAGSIIPTCEPTTHVDEKGYGTLTLNIYWADELESTIIADENSVADVHAINNNAKSIVLSNSRQQVQQFEIWGQSGSSSSWSNINVRTKRQSENVK